MKELKLNLQLTNTTVYASNQLRRGNMTDWRREESGGNVNDFIFVIADDARFKYTYL